MRRSLLFLLCALSLTLTGCMDLRMQLTINKDWSGTTNIRVEMLDQLFQMVKTQMQQASTDLFFLDKDALAAKAEADSGKLRNFTNKNDNGIRQLHVELYYKDMRQMLKTIGEGQLTLKEKDGVWTITMLENELGAAFQDMGQEQIEQQMAMMRSVMTGMKWDIEFKVPKVEGSNMTKANSTLVKYQLDYDQDITEKTGKASTEAFRAFMQPKWISFSGAKKDPAPKK